MTLEKKTDELVTWCQTNAADHTDLIAALTLAGGRLGDRCRQARRDEAAAVEAFIASERAKTGKPPIGSAVEAVAAVAVVARK